MAEGKLVVGTQGLDTIINDHADFPLAQLAAMQLRPLLKTANESLLSASNPVAARGISAISTRHTDAVKPNDDIRLSDQQLAIVASAVRELQSHMFALRQAKLGDIHHKTELENEYEKTKTIAGVLIEAVATLGIEEAVLNGKTQGRKK